MFHNIMTNIQFEQDVRHNVVQNVSHINVCKLGQLAEVKHEVCSIRIVGSFFDTECVKFGWILGHGCGDMVV